MPKAILRCSRQFLTAICLTVLCVVSVFAASEWQGTLRDSAGKPVASAKVMLRPIGKGQEYSATTSANGRFAFAGVEPGSYKLSVEWNSNSWTATDPFVVGDASLADQDLTIPAEGHFLTVALAKREGAATQASGGQHLSSEEVSNLPLNSRDFSKLLLLAAGTMTDANGTANFTQQYSINGQRGVFTVFAMDGGDTTDPELGGATFSNFNVDAIQEVQSSSGVLPAEIGHGASGFTNVVTKSGSGRLHGTAFEFLRNAALDARNFFDHKNDLDPRRIPPFARNEFGFTVGGPVYMSHLYDGRGKTFFFAQYQGFRQVLGTTQVFAVPTADERKGIDTSTFSGDTLNVPVNATIAAILARYPLPNDPRGAFGARTFATSSKVATDTDQFSIRIDQKFSDKSSIFGRFSLNQVNGPITNPDQTAIDPTFGIKFFDHQRSAAIAYARTLSPRLSFTTTFAYVRSTPTFPSNNHKDIGISFVDSLFESFNSADGTITGSFGNLYQVKHDMTFVHKSHTFKWGGEIRLNKDSTVFATNPNGLYAFGGGTTYSPVFIPSTSGLHDIHPGDPLPDSLTALLTATPYEYTITAAYRLTPQGDKFDEAAVRREAYNLYFQDTWKTTPRLTVNLGLRYELNTQISEAKNRTSIGIAVGSNGKETSFLTPGATEAFLYNPRPAYPLRWNGFGPRVSMDYALTAKTMLHAGASITTLLANIWQDNFVTGGIPFVVQPVNTAQQGVPLPFSNSIVPLNIPEPYTTSGQLLFATGDTSKVAANTPIDYPRFQKDLSALTAGNQVQLLTASFISRQFRNGYVGTYTLGLDHDFGIFRFSTSYVGSAGVGLPRVFVPNGYPGARAGYAPFTQFNSSGQAVGGYGPEYIMSSDSHSNYNAWQNSVVSSHPGIGLTLLASYTYAKSLDDTSSPVGNIGINSGVVVQSPPQNPLDPHAERGPSSFDFTHSFSLSAFQALPLERVPFLRPLGKLVTSGWQLLNITSIASGAPFSVYSGIQQTGFGTGGGDRPDLLMNPHFSTSRTRREDYFGMGQNNCSFFLIPVNVPGSVCPNQAAGTAGRFGTLGRNTFRGPAFHQFDFALIKDTPFGRRGTGDLGVVEFRAEFFNIFNIVNFGLPANTILGSGFGVINHTAGSSRQIQFSLKVFF